MTNPVHKIKAFYGETMQEIKKCSWPTRPELVEQTLLVIVAVLMLTGFIWAVDYVLQYLIQLFLIR